MSAVIGLTVQFRTEVTLIAGVVGTYVTSLLKRENWPDSVKIGISFLVSAVVAVVALAITSPSLFHTDSLTQLVSYGFVASQFVFHALGFKNSPMDNAATAWPKRGPKPITLTVPPEALAYDALRQQADRAASATIAFGDAAPSVS
jgi:hypothetical protein